MRGFTIIELIVVIAIIAVLAAIVLVNVTSYIAKSKLAAVKADMSGLITVGATYFADSTNQDKTGSDFASDGSSNGCQWGVRDNAVYNNVGYHISCFGDTGSMAWCAYTPTPNSDDHNFCVDSTGFKGPLGGGTCGNGLYTCQ